MKSHYDFFRQSPDIIKKRIRPFVEYFRDLGTVVDLGCGRGEFLALLTESGIDCMGVDSDNDMIDICVKAGLKAEKDNLFSFLESTGNYGGLFASHVIEHLGGEDAERMLNLCYERLKPCGRLVLITPNPEDISVITKAFWLDLTHVRPYPLVLLEEMLKGHGFRIISSGGAPGTVGEIRFRRTRRMLAGLFLPLFGMKRLWDYLHTAQDIFVVAEKPKR